MNKQELLKVLLEAQTKCKNFYFHCYSVSLSKEEIDFLIGILSEKITPVKGKYTLIIKKDGNTIHTAEKVNVEWAKDFIYKLIDELNQSWNWYYDVKKKHKQVIMEISTHKEHPYGDY